MDARGYAAPSHTLYVSCREPLACWSRLRPYSLYRSTFNRTNLNISVTKLVTKYSFKHLLQPHDARKFGTLNDFVS